MKALREESQSPLDSVLLCGHSMGGALAQVTAALAYSYANKWQNSPPAECSEQEKRIHGLLTKAMRCLLTEKLSCVTLAAPQPFANPSSEELAKWTQLRKDAFKETMKWMDKHLVNYVNGNDLVPRVPGNLDFVIDMLKNAPWMRVSHRFLLAPGLYTFQAADLVQQWEKSCKQLKLYRPVGQTVYIGHASQSDLMTSIPKDPEVVKISTMARWYDACAASYDHQVTTCVNRIHLKTGVKTHLFGYQHGIWEEFFPSGRRLEGVWGPDGNFHHGVLVYPDGTRYEGGFGPYGGLCHGVKICPDGTREEGDFGPYGGLCHGVKICPDGTRVEGDFGPYGGLRHGVKICPDGERWEGEWGPDGKFHGVKVFPDGQREEGDWRPDGEFHGVVVFPDGQRQEGDFDPDDELRHGVMVLPDGTRYEGDWEPGPDGKFHGVKICPDGERWEGEWGPDGKFHGVTVLPDGTRYEGDWEPGPDGKFHGVVVYPDGTRSRFGGA